MKQQTDTTFVDYFRILPNGRAERIPPRSRTNSGYFFKILLIYLFLPLVVFAATPAKSWRFAVISDTQGSGIIDTPEHPWVNTPVVEAIAKFIVSTQAALVVVTGDLITGNMEFAQQKGWKKMTEQYAEWRQAMAPVYKAKIPIYPVRGNHDSYDYHDNTLKTWLDTFGGKLPQNGPWGEKGMTYSFSHSNALFVCLDFYTKHEYRARIPRITQFDWLEDTLATNKLPYVFAFGHPPAFMMSTKTTLHRNTKDRNEFWRLLGENNCTAYFCGHEHVYARAKIAVKENPAVWQVVGGVGGGGINNHWKGRYQESKKKRISFEDKFFANSADNHGVIIVEVSTGGVMVTYWATADLVTWRVLDRFQMR